MSAPDPLGNEWKKRFQETITLAHAMGAKLH